MWKPALPGDFQSGNYMQAATFNGELSALAEQMGAAVDHANEDTGPIRAVVLSGPGDQFAVLVSHELGDPRSIEIRLVARAGASDWAISENALHGVLASMGLTESDCSWVCPLVSPDGDA